MNATKKEKIDVESLTRQLETGRTKATLELQVSLQQRNELGLQELHMLRCQLRREKEFGVYGLAAPGNSSSTPVYVRHGGSFYVYIPSRSNTKEEHIGSECWAHLCLLGGIESTYSTTSRAYVVFQTMN